jgi:hypothetical protein
MTQLTETEQKLFVEWLYSLQYKELHKKKLTLPPRMQVSRNTVCIVANRKITKNELRNACKKHPNYRIKVDNGGVDGATEDREIIVIDTLGKWLFGVSGYKGHIIVMEGSIYLPNESPQEAIKMIKDCIN